MASFPEMQSSGQNKTSTKFQCIFKELGNGDKDNDYNEHSVLMNNFLNS